MEFKMLGESWDKYLKPEFDKEYMLKLKGFLKSEKSKRKVIYPHSRNWFKAFELTQLDNIKVLIIGQDPYHGQGQAHGLCFSVPDGVSVPPSLENIFKEIKTDIGVDNHQSGNLEPWAKQGVMLLNSVLTVAAGNAGSHAGFGWEVFTDKVIEVVNRHSQGVAFMLWGGYAQKKAGLVDNNRHLVLKAPHPSPLSAYRGFLGCRHFSKANKYLNHHGKEEIDWSNS
jgi:uracil-DNA glycosylase